MAKKPTPAQLRILRYLRDHPDETAYLFGDFTGRWARWSGFNDRGKPKISVPTIRAMVAAGWLEVKERNRRQDHFGLSAKGIEAAGDEPYEPKKRKEALWFGWQVSEQYGTVQEVAVMEESSLDYVYATHRVVSKSSYDDPDYRPSTDSVNANLVFKTKSAAHHHLAKHFSEEARRLLDVAMGQKQLAREAEQEEEAGMEGIS